MVTIRLSSEIETELASAAARTGQSKTAITRQAILNYLEDMEDADIAEKALDEFYASGEKAVPLAEVKKRLGIDL
jgi:RHH-type transcriptional regulator, rel operon repressor / antitoxin RelB